MYINPGVCLSNKPSSLTRTRAPLNQFYVDNVPSSGSQAGSKHVRLGYARIPRSVGNTSVVLPIRRAAIPSKVAWGRDIVKRGRAKRNSPGQCLRLVLLMSNRQLLTQRNQKAHCRQLSMLRSQGTGTLSRPAQWRPSFSCRIRL